MSIQARHERERAAVRRAILDAARRLFVTEGFGNVTVRRIAEQIDYSPSAIYGYFENKDEIFLELAEEGFRLLGQSPQDVDDSPLGRLRSHYRRYYDFSCSHGEYFAVMFLERSLPAVRDKEQFAFLEDLKKQGPQLVRACAEAGAIPASVNPDTAATVLWAAVHGPAVIRVTWPLAAEAADALAANVLEAVVSGLCAGVVLEPITEPQSEQVESAALVAAGEENS